MSDFDTLTPPQATSVEPTPAPSDNGAPSSPQSTTPTAPQPGATPGGNENYVPSYRLREARESYEKRLQQEIAREKSQWDTERQAFERKVQALAGVLPAEESRADQIKEQFFNLFPQYRGLTPEKIAALEKVIERQEALEAENELRWQSHSHTKLNELYSLAETAGLPANDQVKSMLHTALIGYLSANPQEQRRFASDPGFISEFFKAYSAAMIDPLRRAQQAAIQGRPIAAVPQDSPSGAVRVGTPPLKPKDLNERSQMSWTAFQQSKNGTGI